VGAIASGAPVDFYSETRIGRGESVQAAFVDAVV